MIVINNCDEILQLKFSNYSSSLIWVVGLLLTGCATNNVAQPQHGAIGIDENTSLQASAMTYSESKNVSQRVQCNRDLESLRTVSLWAYHHYQTEYDRLMKSSAGFVTVKDDAFQESAELARPRLEDALVSLCYRIKGALAESLINQASGR